MDEPRRGGVKWAHLPEDDLKVQVALIKTGVGALVREGTPMLTVVHDSGIVQRGRGCGRSLLDEIVRDGARQMLAAALQAEVAAYIDAHAGEVDENGRRLVVRNGYHHEREVLTAAGAVTVTAPRVNDKRIDADTGERQRFSSAILPAWARKSPQMTEVLPLLYLHGLSTSDFGPALEQFLGSGAGLSATTITRLTAQWQDEAKAFGQPRSVGHRLRLPVGRRHPPQGPPRAGEALPAGDDRGARRWPQGARRADRRVPGVDRVVGRSAAVCRRRGMTAPVLAVGDGALGFWKAVREVFPATREQRCWFHKQANVLAALPKSAHPGALAAMQGDLQRRGHRQGAGRDQGVRGRLRRQVPQGGRQDRRRRRRAAGVLQVSGRALDPPAHH